MAAVSKTETNETGTLNFENVVALDVGKLLRKTKIGNF